MDSIDTELAVLARRRVEALDRLVAALLTLDAIAARQDQLLDRKLATRS